MSDIYTADYNPGDTTIEAFALAHSLAVGERIDAITEEMVRHYMPDDCIAGRRHHIAQALAAGVRGFKSDADLTGKDFWKFVDDIDELLADSPIIASDWLRSIVSVAVHCLVEGDL